MKFTSVILPLLASSTAAFGPSLLPVANRLSSTKLNDKFEVIVASGPGGDYNGNLEITMENAVAEHKEDLSVNYSASGVEVHVYETGDDFGGPNSVLIKPNGGGSFTCGGIYVTNLDTGEFFYHDKFEPVVIPEGERKELPMEYKYKMQDIRRSEKFDLKIETGEYGIENLHVKLITSEGIATPVQNIGSFPENAFESVSINTDIRGIDYAEKIEYLFLFKPPSSKPSELYHLSTKGDDKTSPRGDFLPFHFLNDEQNNWILVKNIHDYT